MILDMFQPYSRANQFAARSALGAASWASTYLDRHKRIEKNSACEAQHTIMDFSYYILNVFPQLFDDFCLSRVKTRVKWLSHVYGRLITQLMILATPFISTTLALILLTTPPRINEASQYPTILPIPPAQRIQVPSPVRTSRSTSV